MNKEELENLTNLELVELLLDKQHECDILRHERDQYKDSRIEDNGKWWELHEQVYKLADEVITIKYMIIKRMGGCSGTGK